jgi:hypothetical protein
MDTWINRILSQRKRKRFLVQTGNRKITATFFRDGKESHETNYVPIFKNFVQVICYTKDECISILELQQTEYIALHEVIHPLIIDGAELHQNLFKDGPPHLKN